MFGAQGFGNTNQVLVILQFLEKLTLHVFDTYDWRDCHEPFHMLLIEFWILAQLRKELSSSLTMPYIGNLLNTCLLHNILPKGWLIVLSHFCE